MKGTTGAVRVVDVPPPAGTGADGEGCCVEGCAFDPWGAPFVVDPGVSVGLCTGDRLLGIDAASLLTAPASSVHRHLQKLKRYGGKVVIQRVPGREFRTLLRAVRSTSVSSRSEPAEQLSVRPLLLDGAPTGAGAVSVLPVTVAHLRQHATAFGRHDGRLTVCAPIAHVPRLQPGDVILEVDGRSMVALHNPCEIWRETLAAALRSTVLLTVVRGPALPVSATRAAPAPELTAAPIDTNTQQLAVIGGASRGRNPVDTTLLRRLDEAHLRLQLLTTVDFPEGSRMPDLRTLPDMDSPEARRSEQHARTRNLAPPPAACAFELCLLVAMLPLDLGFALGDLSAEEDAVTMLSGDGTKGSGKAAHVRDGNIVIHSVWGDAALATGLSPGLTLLAINGEDVSKSTPLRVLKSLMVMLMSPVQRRGTLSLLVLPCTELLAHAWAPNAPRHVLLMRSDTATGESDQSATASSVAPLAHAAVFGIEAVAGASRETLAFVSRVAEDAVAGHGAVQVADRIAAINGVKITGTSYIKLANLLAAHCSGRFLILELHGAHAGYGLFQPREVTVKRAAISNHSLPQQQQQEPTGAFGFVVAGATTRAGDRRRAAGVYVWHVHEPALCGQLVAGDRILQVRNHVTTLATVRDVHRLLQEGGSELRLTVRSDPAGYVALATEAREGGTSPEGLLAQQLLQAGLPLDEPVPEALAMHPGASTPVASAHLGAVSTRRHGRSALSQHNAIGSVGSAAQAVKASTYLDRMLTRVQGEQTANGKMSQAVAEFGQRWQAVPGAATQAPATPAGWQAERPMASRTAVFTPVLQVKAAPSPSDSLVADTPLRRRLGLQGPAEDVSPVESALLRRMAPQTQAVAVTPLAPGLRQ